MLKFTATDLAEKSAVFRYVYYVLTAFNPKSFRTWQREGEPNPFVEKTYRQHVTDRIEFVDIFSNELGVRNARAIKRR